MSGFWIRNPFFLIVVCFVVGIVGTVMLVRMPVDLFPPINIPVVVIATFYSGMPPQQIETNITNPFERWFTLAAGRKPDQNLFSARHECGRRPKYRLQPGYGGSAPIAARHAATGGSEV